MKNRGKEVHHKLTNVLKNLDNALKVMTKIRSDRCTLGFG
jgi:hypothetical protein